MSISLNFKLSAASGGTTFDLTDLEPSMTVLDVKGKFEAHTQMKPEACRCIYKGKILKDADTLESINVKSGEQVHIVKSAAKPAEPAANTAAAPAAGGATAGGYDATVQAHMNDPAAVERALQAMMGGGGAAAAPVNTGAAFPAMTQAQQPNPLAAMMAQQQAAGGGGGEMPDVDPAMFQQMMANPAMQGVMQQMLSNPAVMQQMFAGNPMLERMMHDPNMAGLIGGVEGMFDGMEPEQLENIMSEPSMEQAIGQIQGQAAGEDGEGGEDDDEHAQAMREAQLQNMLLGAGGTSGRCACGNFDSGQGDGLCNSCRAKANEPKPDA